MKIKYHESFVKEIENIEYIECLCKRYLQILNTDVDFLGCNDASRIKAEFERIGKSLRLATIEFEKGLK